MHFLHAAVFDLLLATSSRYNEHPSKTPRPFDAGRDGLVVAEGAGTLVLEEYEQCKAPGAQILAELEGFWTTAAERTSRTRMPPLLKNACAAPLGKPKGTLTRYSM